MRSARRNKYVRRLAPWASPEGGRLRAPLCGGLPQGSGGRFVPTLAWSLLGLVCSGSSTERPAPCTFVSTPGKYKFAARPLGFPAGAAVLSAPPHWPQFGRLRHHQYLLASSPTRRMCLRCPTTSCLIGTAAINAIGSETTPLDPVRRSQVCFNPALSPIYRCPIPRF